MDFEFSEEQELLRQTVRTFVDKEIRPIAAKIDTEKKIPESLIAEIRDLGLFGVAIPEEYGGLGAGEMGNCIMMEELARGCASTACLVGGHLSLCAMSIIHGGSEDINKKYLPAMATGEKLGCFALTEAGAGSDAGSIRTKAERDGDHYRINGTKLWITNGDTADLIALYAKVPRGPGRGGITAILVEKDTPGVSVGKREDKLGIRGSGTAELIFDNVMVPAENVLGEEGGGLRVAMNTLDQGRITVAASSIGAAKECLKMAAEHANQREQFGRTIGANQGIQWMFADMTTDIYAAESSVYRAAWKLDQGKKASRDAAIVKYMATEALDRVVDKALQIHGSTGYSREHPIERFYRDARVNRIFEGTNEIQKIIIGRDVLKKGY